MSTDGSDTDSSSSSDGGTFGDLIEEEGDDVGDDVSVGGQEYETPDERPDTPSNDEPSSSSNSSSGTFGDLIEEKGDEVDDDISVAGKEYDTPDKQPDPGIPESKNIRSTRSRRTGRSRQSELDQKIQRMVESDKNVLDPDTGSNNPIGQESATNLGREGLPKTGVQEYISDVQETGREYNREVATEGEQFGDWDWTFRGVDLEEEARDLEEGAREAGGNVGDDVGTAVPDALDIVGADQAAEEVRQTQTIKTTESLTRGAGEGVGSLVGGIPVIGMEAAETTVFAAKNPKEAASKAPAAAAGSATATSRQFREDPARTTGSIASQTLLSAGVGRAASTAVRGTSTASRVRSAADSTSTRLTRAAERRVERRRSGTPGTDRGQMSMGDLVPERRRDGDSGGSSSGIDVSSGGDSLLPDEIDDFLGNFERGSRIREANRRAEQRTTEKRLEEGRRQERGDEPRTIDTRPGGDYRAPDRGGDYVADPVPDTSRSGPTGPQSSISRSRLETELSPRETQLAAKLGRQTPSADMRGVDNIARTAPETDLRAAEGPASSQGSAGLMAPAASATTLGMTSMLDQAQQPEVTVDDVSPPDTREDTDTSARSRSNTGTDSLDILDDAQDTTAGVTSDIDSYLDSLRDSDTTTQTDATSGIDTDTRDRPDDDPIQPRDPDTSLPRDDDPTPSPRDPDGRPDRPRDDDTDRRRPRRPQLPELETDSASSDTDTGLGYDQLRVEYDVPDPSLLGGDIVDDSQEYEIVDDSQEYEVVDETEVETQRTSSEASEETDDWQGQIDQADDIVLESLDDLDQSLDRGMAKMQPTEQQTQERADSATRSSSRSQVSPSSVSFALDPIGDIPAFETAVTDTVNDSGGFGMAETSSLSLDLMSEFDDEYAALDAGLDDLENDLEAELDALDDLEGFGDGW